MLTSHFQRAHISRKDGGGVIVELTSHMISLSRVIARGERIRDLQRLVLTYGGRKS